MPGEGAVVPLLQKFLKGFEQVRGKDENAFMKAWEANRDTFDQLPKKIQDHLQSMHDKVKKLFKIGPKSDAEYINLFMRDLEVLLDAIVKFYQKALEPTSKGVVQQGSTRPYRKKFDRCVKTVRRRIQPRPGSNKESAAIAICTKSVLHTRGRTMKKYKKGKLVTQKF